MSKNKSTDGEYVQVRLPEPEKLAEYIKQAKGENRTMAEFAKACKSVSPSTFSRIVNGNITRPLSAELIRTIIKNADDPESLNLDDFMRANGMLRRSELERQSFSGSIREREKIYGDVKHIIADELYSRGCMLRIYPGLPQEELPESGFFQHWRSRLAITVQGYEPRFWNFIIHIPFSDHYSSLLGDDESSRLEGGIRRILDKWSFIFLRDTWEPETLRDVKNSFVFTEKQLYEAFCELMMKIKVNTYMSVILIDIARQRVVEEKMIPRNDNETPSSIFDEKKISGF